MNWSTVSYLIGVTGASFMSSTAMFSLFNKEIMDRREKVRQNVAKVVEEHRRRKTGAKKTRPKSLGERIGRAVMYTAKKFADGIYGVWFFFNIVPVGISIFLAFVVSAPVAFPNMQDWASQWLIPLLKVGVWGFMVSLVVQIFAILLMFFLHRMVENQVLPEKLLNPPKHSKD